MSEPFRNLPAHPPAPVPVPVRAAAEAAEAENSDVYLRPLGSGILPDPSVFYLQEKGRAAANTVSQEVMLMLAAAWLMLSSLLYSLQLSTGSFPKPLSEEEERHYLALAAQGDLDARNVLIERNLRLVAHIM